MTDVTSIPLTSVRKLNVSNVTKTIHVSELPEARPFFLARQLSEETRP